MPQMGVRAKLSASSIQVPGGLYDPTTLVAVDADLAAANIKSGVTIFGVAGAATVQDISAADAAVTDVKAPRTFFSVTGAIKTGTMPTVALDPALNAYPAGYHAGAASLTAVDADLVTGNIKSGVNIFGVAGAATVQDIADANLTVAEAPTGKTFYAVTGSVKTGTGTKTLDPANDTVAAGYYAATTLSAVDADLAVGNIKSGAVVFGFTGTYLSTPAEDMTGSTIDATAAPTSLTSYKKSTSIAAGGDLDVVSNTSTYAAGDLAVAVGMAMCASDGANSVKLRLYMDGVQIAESAYLLNTDFTLFSLAGTKALSGSKVCKLSAHNYAVGAQTLDVLGGANLNSAQAAGVGVAGVKVVA